MTTPNGKHDHPMHPLMRDRARQLRQDSSIPERVLWSMLRDRRLAGLKFRRQHPIGPFVVDFFCEQAQIVIELDGESHVGRADEDQRRSVWVQSQGLQVLRIMIDDLQQSPDAVAQEIARAAGIEL